LPKAPTAMDNTPHSTELLNAWAADVVRLEWRIADVSAERDVYQEIAHAALDQLHSTTLALDRTRTQLWRLTEQVRNTTAEPAPTARTHTPRHGTQPRRYRSIYRRTPDPSLEVRV
jgi:hypothetical protein